MADFPFSKSPSYGAKGAFGAFEGPFSALMAGIRH